MFDLGERDYKADEQLIRFKRYNYKHTLSIMHTMLRLSAKSSEILPAERGHGVRVRECEGIDRLQPESELGPTELTWRESDT